MLSIYKAFFCDTVEEAQFGKLNLIGLNASRMIILDRVPYRFTTYLILLGYTDEASGQISVHLAIKDQDSDLIQAFDLDIDLGSDAAGRCVPLTCAVPVALKISLFGEMTVTVRRRGEKLHEEQYAIVSGDAPHIGTMKPLFQSVLFGGQQRVNAEFVDELLGVATSSLKIFDGYVRPSDLRILLSKVKSTVCVKLLTWRYEKELRFDTSLPLQFPNLEIRFSKASHDRFVIVNETEYYHFGHSLKDVASGKLSRCSRITNREEVKTLADFFEQEWGFCQ